MSDFPRLNYMLDDSSCESLAGYEPVRATNGKLYVRRMFTSDERNFSLSFLLNSAGISSLRTHYTGHKDASFAFFWPGDNTTYTVSYVSPPQESRIGPGHWRVRVQLMER